MSEQNNENKKENKIEDELSKIKEEMQELKEMLRDKKDSGNSEYWDDDDEEDDDFDFGKPRGFKFKIDKDFGDKFDDIDINLDGIDFTLNNYVASVMKGVSENIKRSMESATQGIHRMENNIARKARREAEKEIRRGEKEIRKSMRKMKKSARASHRHHERDAASDRVIHLNKLSESELEDFYEVGTKMVGALSDPRRIKLLTLLEDGPAYQGDLSDKTGVKGGTFKHHMDTLLSARYVYQEATRGRYLITQLGVEALKLAEMLYRRYKFEEGEATVQDIQVEYEENADDMNHGITEDDESKVDINETSDVVGESPSEELNEIDGDEQ